MFMQMYNLEDCSSKHLSADFMHEVLKIVNNTWIIRGLCLFF